MAANATETATATETTTETTQTQFQKTCSVQGAVEQLSATSETGCCDTLYQESVRERAYLLWEKAGYPIGDGVNFWIAAEQELLAISSN